MSDRLKLRQLNCFVAVAEELNFRRAADRLAMTQPPLSRLIRALEETLDTRLFDRDRQGVRLTPAGERLLVDARALLRDSRQVLERFRGEGADRQNEVRLGVTTSIDVGLFSWIGAAAEQPVTIKRQISALSIRDLDQGQLDLAVIGLPARADGLAVEPLFDDPMVACLASSHPLARKRRLSLLQLQDDRLFWFRRALNPAFHDYCERIFKSLGYAPERIAEPPDHAMLLGLIAAGQGVALIPESLTSVTRKGVVFRRLLEDDTLRIRIALAWRPSDLPEGATALIARIRQRFAPPA